MKNPFNRWNFGITVRAEIYIEGTVAECISPRDTSSCRNTFFPLMFM